MKFEGTRSVMFANMLDILRYLPFPLGVVALWGIQNQGFDFVEVELYYAKCTFDTVFRLLSLFAQNLPLTWLHGPPALCDWW